MAVVTWRWLPRAWAVGGLTLLAGASVAADPAETARILADGAAKARGVAATTLARARDHIGLLPPT